MIDRQRLAELRKAIMDHSIKTMCGSDHPCRYDPMELFDTIDKLLTVKEAAEGVAWFVDTLDDNCDASNEDEASYIEQKKAFKKALAAVKEGA